MNRMEERLRSSLKRRTPPPGFAERVIARTRERRVSRSGWRLAAIAAAVVAAVSLGIFQLSERRHGTIEGEKARDQLLTGLQITANKLQFVREKLTKTGFPAKLPVRNDSEAVKH